MRSGDASLRLFSTSEPRQWFGPHGGNPETILCYVKNINVHCCNALIAASLCQGSQLRVVTFWHAGLRALFLLQFAILFVAFTVSDFCSD